LVFLSAIDVYAFVRLINMILDVFLPIQLCQNDDNSTCQCIANDEYLVSKQNFTCRCRKGFRGDRCETAHTKLILSFDKNIVLTQSIFIYFIQVMNKSILRSKIDYISNDFSLTRFDDGLLTTTISSCFY
jgi:hypothetical protein